MIISFIVAADEKNGMGLKGELPWRLPDDFKFFKNKTLNHHILMGRKTFDSLGKPLKDRPHIVITHKTDYQPDGVLVLHDIDEGIQFAANQGEEEIFIIGGAEIFKQTFDKADKLYLTRVHGVFVADTFFPEFDKSKWEQTWTEEHPADERHIVPFTFQLWEKKKD